MKLPYQDQYYLYSPYSHLRIEIFWRQPYNPKLSRIFNSNIAYSNLNDVGYDGEVFTLANNQLGTSYIEARVDKFLFSNHWLEIYITILINIFSNFLQTTILYSFYMIKNFISGLKKAARTRIINLRKFWPHRKKAGNCLNNLKAVQRG